MKILDIAFTGYPVTDIKRARHFYEEVLGLTPSFLWGDETTAWIEYSIGSGTLAIGKAGAVNAALLAVAVLALNDAALATKLDQWRAKQTASVADAPTDDA